MASRNLFLLGRRPGFEDQLTEMLVWLISAVPEVGGTIVQLAFADLDVGTPQLQATTQHRIAAGRLDALLRTESLVLVVESKLGSFYGEGQLHAYIDWLATEHKDAAHRALMTLTANEAPWPADDLARRPARCRREPAALARAAHRALATDLPIIWFAVEAPEWPDWEAALVSLEASPPEGWRSRPRWYGERPWIWRYLDDVVRTGSLTEQQSALAAAAAQVRDWLLTARTSSPVDPGLTTPGQTDAAEHSETDDI
jgi:hypothetical protein